MDCFFALLIHAFIVLLFKHLNRHITAIWWSPAGSIEHCRGVLCVFRSWATFLTTSSIILLVPIRLSVYCWGWQLLNMFSLVYWVIFRNTYFANNNQIVYERKFTSDRSSSQPVELMRTCTIWGCWHGLYIICCSYISSSSYSTVVVNNVISWVAIVSDC